MEFFRRELTKKEALIIIIAFVLLLISIYYWINHPIIKGAIIVKGFDNNALLFNSRDIELTKDSPSVAYKFKVKSNSELDIKYNIYIENISDINTEYINYSLEKNKIEVSSKLFSELGNHMVVDSDILSEKEENTYVLKVWINEKGLSKVQDEKYNFKLKIDGEQSNLYPFQVTVTMPKDSKTEKNFSWHTNYDSNSDIQLIKAKNIDRNNVDFSDASQLIEFKGEKLRDADLDDYVHRVKVRYLDSGSRYYYRVGDKKRNIWSNVGEFVTDDGDNHFKFLYIADPQAYLSEEKNSTYAIRKAKEIIGDAEFILNAGDLVNDSRDKEQWKKNLNFAVYGDITTINSVGNHDYNFGEKYNYSFVNNFYYDYDKQNTKSGLYYSINYGDVHITVLNTNDKFYSKLGNNQLEWLKKDLQTSSARDAKYRIVLMHRGIYTTGPHYYYHKDILPLTDQLTSVMAEGNVDLVLQGHDHVYSLTYPIDENGNIDMVNYKEIYSDEIKANVLAMDSNKFPVYFIGDSIGVKHEAQLLKENEEYVVDRHMNKNYTNLFDTYTLENYFSKFQIRSTPYNMEKVRYGVFSSIEVNDNNLIVNSYVVDNLSYKELRLYKSFALTK